MSTDALNEFRKSKGKVESRSEPQSNHVLKVNTAGYCGWKDRLIDSCTHKPSPSLFATGQHDNCIEKIGEGIKKVKI